MNLQDARIDLVAVGRQLHQHGWVPATSGNFSLRLDSGEVAITASGKDKGRLVAGDIMRVAIDGTALDAQRPSAETALHTQLYRRSDAVHCVLHTHSAGAALISERNPDGLTFEGLEILKAFAGIDTHAARIHIPVFANTQDIEALAADVEAHMRAKGQGVAYLIAGHGLYTWGKDSRECQRHLEALEYLFDYHRLSADAAG